MTPVPQHKTLDSRSPDIYLFSVKLFERNCLQISQENNKRLRKLLPLNLNLFFFRIIY